MAFHRNTAGHTLYRCILKKIRRFWCMQNSNRNGCESPHRMNVVQNSVFRTNSAKRQQVCFARTVHSTFLLRSRMTAEKKCICSNAFRTCFVATDSDGLGVILFRLLGQFLTKLIVIKRVINKFSAAFNFNQFTKFLAVQNELHTSCDSICVI